MLHRRHLPALGAALLGAGPALAQPAWPSKPLRFVIPWPPGGLNDLIARAVNEQAAQQLGVTVVNDFKPGAGSRIGVAEIARSAPDGYTIGMGNLGSMTIYPHLYRDMPYDVKRDLVPITMFAASPLVLVANKDLPANSVADLIALAKARPGRLNYASIGIGSAQHLLFEMFRLRQGAAMEHIPYKGTPESLLALVQNDVQAQFDTLPSMLAPIRDGRIKALAVTTPQRVPQLPNVPTLAEAGYPDINIVTWYAVIAPAGTPAPVQARLYRAYTAAAQHPDVQKLMTEQGLITLPTTQAEFAARIEAESARWGEIIRAQNIKVE